MNENQLKFLWDNYANNKGFSGYDEFKSLMANDNSRKVFFENSNKELGFKDYNEFEGVLGVKKKEGTQAASGQPVQQPGQPSAPSFGQKVVTQAFTSGEPIMTKGLQKKPVEKKPYQDISYKPEAMPTETVQAVETPVVKAAKQDFKQTQLKPPVKAPVTAQGIKELEDQIKEPDKTFLKFQDYQTSVDDLDELEGLYDEDLSTFQAKLSTRPDLYAKYSGRNEQEVVEFFNALSDDSNPYRRNEAQAQFKAEAGALYENFVRDYKSLKSKHGEITSELGVMTDKLVSDVVNENTYRNFLAKREFAVGPTNAEATFGEVISMDDVDRVATEIVDSYGLPTDGEAWRLVKNKVKGEVFNQYVKPLVKDELKRTNPDLLTKRQQIFEAGFQADDDIYGKAESMILALQAQYEQDAKAEMDLINSQYVGASDILNQAYDQVKVGIEKQQADLLSLYQNGQIDQLEYESSFSKLEEDKKLYYDQYQKNYPSYDEYVKKSNEINSRYSRKFEIQKKLISDKAQAELEAAYKKYAETYQEDPKILEELDNAYKAAYDNVVKRQGEIMKIGASMSANPLSSLYNSTMSAMGGVFKGWGGSMGSKSLELLGETMEQNFTMPAPRTEDFSDWTDPQNVSMITGNVLGSMGPTMIPTAAAAIGTTYFTGGLGFPASVNMVTAGLTGALAGWGAETIDVAGRSYLDVFERSGGDVVRANQAAKRSLKSQYDIMWAYSFEALPFIGKAFKFVPTRAARAGAGGLVELGTEFTQEIRQNIAEENIVEFERDPWYNFDEAINDERKRKQTLISIGPVALMGGAGQIGSKSIYQERRDAAVAQQQKSALAYGLPDQKRQYIQNMVFNKNGKFANSVIASLFAAGKIDEKQSADLMIEVQRAEKIKESGKTAGLKGSKLNIYGFYTARAEEAERNAGRFAGDPILKKSYEDMAKQYRDAGIDFMNGKSPDLLTLTYADGSQVIMLPEDVNALFADPVALSLLNQNSISIEAYDKNGQGPKIIEELRGRAETYAKKNRYTEASKITSPMQTLRQNIDVRINQLYAERTDLNERQKQQEAERIRQEETIIFEEKQRQQQQQESGQRDIEVERLQKQRMSLGIDDVLAFFSDMKPLVATMVERMEAGQAAPKSGVKAASDYLYAKYKELTAMKSDPNRMMTIAQIESIQAQIEQDLQTLEGNPPSQKTEARDQENIQGIPGQVGVGQELVQGQPIQGAGQEATTAGGVLQAQGEEEIELRPSENLPTVTITGEIVEEKPTTTAASKPTTEADEVFFYDAAEAAAEQVGTQPSVGINQKAESVETSSIQERVKATNAKIKRKDIFDGVGAFSEKLGGSDVESVPVGHSEIGNAEIVQYANPKTGIIDVIVAGITENDFVGFYRIYENGKPTNKWSSKFETQTASKEDFKGMISGVQNALPQGHEYTETTSISTDGLRVWNQQLNRGYELQYDEKGKLVTTPVYINGDSKTNILGIPVNKGAFDAISVTNMDTFNKVKEVLLPFLEKFGLNETNIRAVNGSVEIDLPVLRQKSTPTTTEAAPEVKAEEKPTTVSKPSRRERLAKMFETSEGEEAVPLIEQALSESGIKVEVKDDADYNEDDRIKSGQGRGSEGMFITDDGTIVLNRDKIKGEWGKTIVFHEGIHPVINIIRNTDPKRYKAIVDGLKAEAARNNDVAQAAADVAASEDYQKRGAATIEDETLVETMARVGAGDINIDTFEPSFREKFIEFMNDIAKMLGLKRIAVNSPRMEVKRLADQINKMLNEGGKLSGIVGKENVGKFQNTIESLKTLSSPINQPSTLTRARKGIYGKKINYKKGGYELSLVKPEDIIDIEALIKKITDEKAVVWFWAADQLGRGMYSDETIDGEHYLDAGPSFALDEENRAENVIWASGAKEKVLRDNIEESDYIFIVSGSPQQSKLFNKKVVEFLRKRTEKASGLSWNDFSKKVIDLTTKTTKAGNVNKNEITNILEKYNSFEELLNSRSNDRKKLFVEMEKQRTKTNTPLSQYLKSIGLSFDVDTLRDGFYKENGFDMNDVMLVLKPTKLGGKSKHSTYEYNILGTVIGVPDKRVNGIDLLPEERRKKYTEVQRKSPMSGPGGWMTSKIQASKGIKRGSNLVKDTYYESGLTEDKNDYIFFHVSSAPEASIRKGIDSTKYTSLRTAREEKGLQYGVASYYTRPEDGERMVGGEKYAVRVPKGKVYPIDSDPLGYGEKAEAKVPQGTPFRAEAVKREIADMAKKNGYEMIVGEWSYSRTGKPAGELPEFRADALVPLKPTKEKPESFTSNAEKGMERIPFPGQQSEEAKQELGNLAAEVRDIMSAKKKFSSKEYSLADDVYMNGQVRENKYEDDEFSRDITAEEYDMMTKVLPKSMQAEVARVRGLLFRGKGQASMGIPRGVKQFSDNVSDTVDRIKSATGEDGATLNLDGSTYEDGGLVVPAGSINVAQDDVSAEGLFEFLKDNEDNISSDIFKIGLYRFPDRAEVSYDLNIVIPREYRDVALKFGELAGQESLFDLDTYENIKTGSDGKNPRKFTAQELAEIAKDLSEGRLPKIVSKEGQPSMLKRTSAEVQRLMEDSMDAVDQDIADGVDAKTAVEDNITSQDWYGQLTPKQKEQFDEIIKDEFGVTPKAPAKKVTGVGASIQNIVDNYYKLKEGNIQEKRAAKAAINEILDADPKLKYIYDNISSINKQLQDAGVITDKTDGCP